MRLGLLKRLTSSLHLDSTSFHLDGEYDGLVGQQEGDIQIPFTIILRKNHEYPTL